MNQQRQAQPQSGGVAAPNYDQAPRQQQQQPQGDAVVQLQEAFFHFDEDKDFYLTLDELRHLVTSDGEPMNDVEEFLAEAAQFADASGYVDYRAFAAMMASEDE